MIPCLFSLVAIGDAQIYSLHFSFSWKASSSNNDASVVSTYGEIPTGSHAEWNSDVRVKRQTRPRSSQPCRSAMLMLIYLVEPFVLFLYFIVYFFLFSCAVTCLICMHCDAYKCLWPWHCTWFPSSNRVLVCRYLLSISPSSVDAERAFFVAGVLYTKVRLSDNWHVFSALLLSEEQTVQ